MVGKLVDFIDHNYTRKISVWQMLEDIPLSRRSIENRFRKVMGRSIYSYVLDCRINKVAQLLITTDKTILQICEEAGVQDPDSLTKLFKQRYSCSPSEYREGRCVFSSNNQ